MNWLNWISESKSISVQFNSHILLKVPCPFSLFGFTQHYAKKALYGRVSRKIKKIEMKGMQESWLETLQRKP